MFCGLKNEMNPFSGYNIHYVDSVSVVSSCMKTSWNENIFRVTGPLCGKFTAHRWIPLTKASDAEFWCYLWSAPWIKMIE